MLEISAPEVLTTTPQEVGKGAKVIDYADDEELAQNWQQACVDKDWYIWEDDCVDREEFKRRADAEGIDF